MRRTRKKEPSNLLFFILAVKIWTYPGKGNCEYAVNTFCDKSICETSNQSSGCGPALQLGRDDTLSRMFGPSCTSREMDVKTFLSNCIMQWIIVGFPLSFYFRILTRPRDSWTARDVMNWAVQRLKLSEAARLCPPLGQWHFDAIIHNNERPKCKWATGGTSCSRAHWAWWQRELLRWDVLMMELRKGKGTSPY